MSRKSVVKKIRSAQRSGVEVRVTTSPHALPLKKHLTKLREEARWSERLTAADLEIHCH